MKRIIYSIIAFLICFTITCIGALLNDLTELETLSFVFIISGAFGVSLIVIFWICQKDENDW